MLVIYAVVLACVTSQWAESARILAVETMGGKSHWNFMSGVIHALLERGHRVTAFTPFTGGTYGENYTEVDISDVVVKVRDTNLEVMVHKWDSLIGNVGRYVAMSRQHCDGIYEHPEMKQLLRRRVVIGHADFDAVLIEPFVSDCVSYAAARLGVPLIYVVPLPVASTVQRFATGHFTNPALESNVMAHHQTPTSFVRRLTNTATFVYFELARAYHDSAAHRYKPAKDSVSVTSIPPSLVFINRHYVSCSAPSPTPTEVIDVGGIHLTRPLESLPADILEFIEQSPSGVIYFSFGSTVKISTLPEHLKKAFIKALAQVPQKVLLKYEEDDMKEKPKNVMVAKWLPQREILLHPNVKLFISHGGISGLYEAVDAGVPVLGFPLFGDQPRNIDNFVNAGMAISMDLSTVTEETFLNNVLEILNNKKYTTNAKIVSEIFKDRPLSPAEQVVYWTEYVIRHKGASHLKSHAFNLTWYQYYLLDVIFFVFVLSFIFLFIALKYLIFVIKCVLNFLRNVKVKSE